MSAVIINDEILVPEWVKDLPSFRRWADSEEFPEDARISYVAARKSNGWLKSNVFGKSFRLSQRQDPAGYPDYVLDVR